MASTGKISMKLDTDELRVLLTGSTTKLRRSVMGKAMRKSGSIIVRATRTRIRSRSGLTKKALGSKTSTYKKATIFTQTIGTRTGYRGMFQGRPHDPTNTFHLQELGTRPHSVARNAQLMRVRRLKGGGIKVNLPLLGKPQKPHPGAKGTHALRRSVDAEHGKVEYEVWAAVDTALAGK